MIGTIKHKGLQQLYEQDGISHLRTDVVSVARRFLAALEAAEIVQELDLPGYRLRRLTSTLPGHWTVTLSRTHRIIFRFEEGQALDVDLVDYH